MAASQWSKQPRSYVENRSLQQEPNGRRNTLRCLSSGFQLLLLYLHDFFRIFIKIQALLALECMITEVMLIAIRIQAPLSLLVLFLLRRIRGNQRNLWWWAKLKRLSKEFVLSHVSYTGSCRHGDGHGHGHAFSRAKPSPAQVDQAMVRNLLFFCFNALSWTMFHKPLRYLFFQIHPLYEISCVFKLSTFLDLINYLFLGLPHSEGMVY